jgi:hypothetical protein
VPAEVKGVIMGKADRRMQRARAALDAAYADALRPHRLSLSALDEPDARAVHDAAFTVARRAADREGGPAWIERAGTTADELSAALWGEHLAPFRSAASDR